MTKKQLYETPEAEVLVVKIERNLLTGSYGEQGAAGAKVTNGGVYDFDDE